MNYSAHSSWGKELRAALFCRVAGCRAKGGGMGYRAAKWQRAGRRKMGKNKDSKQCENPDQRKRELEKDPGTGKDRE